MAPHHLEYLCDSLLLILYLTHCRDTGVYFLGHVHEPLRLLVLLPILPLNSLLIMVVTASVCGFIIMFMLLLFMKTTFGQLVGFIFDSSLGSCLLLGLRIEGWGCGCLVFGGVREREVTMETRLGELGLDKWETYELRLLRRY
jgi:hypothetical protein